MNRYKIRRQRPLKGGRVRAYVSLDPWTAQLVEDTMRKFRVARSFVLNVMSTEGGGGEPVETFLPVPKSGVKPLLKEELARPRPRLVKRG